MTSFKKILSNTLILLTTAAFVISTTGFTTFKHQCTHHETVNMVLPINDDCCSSDEMIVNKKKVENCCSDMHCGTEENHSSCCTDEMSYHRLSDWYTLVDSEKITLPFRAIILTKNLKEIPQEPESVKEWELNHETLIKFSFPPKYLLYSQIKLDPPLI